MPKPKRSKQMRGLGRSKLVSVDEVIGRTLWLYSNHGDPLWAIVALDGGRVYATGYGLDCGKDAMARMLRSHKRWETHIPGRGFACESCGKYTWPKEHRCKVSEHRR